MRIGVHAIGILALMMISAPVIAQTVTSTAAYPYCKESTLPPGVARPALPTDPSAPCWMLLWGYGSNNQLYQHWQLIDPQAFDVTNYHGFHTPGQ
jgi:hypothetical protein